MSIIEMWFNLKFWSAIVCYGILGLLLITYGILVSYDKFKRHKNKNRDGK